MIRACDMHGREVKHKWNFVGKPEGRGLLGRPRCRWEGNIQMDLKNVGWECADCIYLAQGRDSGKLW